MSVDFPLPVEPIKATVSPCLAVKLTFSSTYSEASGYLKETFLNTTLPCPPSLGDCVTVPPLICASVESTSLIRRTETMARGRMIKIMASIMKAETTIIA